MCEQTLKALGMEVCGDLVANRGLIAALFSPIATDSFLSAGLGLGRTVHGEAPKEGEVSRKGISCERTFAAISSAADLEAKVCMHVYSCVVHCQSICWGVGQRNQLYLCVRC